MNVHAEKPAQRRHETESAAGWVRFHMHSLDHVVSKFVAASDAVHGGHGIEPAHILLKAHSEASEKFRMELTGIVNASAELQNGREAWRTANRFLGLYASQSAALLNSIENSGSAEDLSTAFSRFFAGIGPKSIGKRMEKKREALLKIAIAGEKRR